MLKMKLVGLSLLAAVLLPLNAAAGDIRDLQPAQCKFSFLLKQEICDFAPYISVAVSDETAVPGETVIPEFRTILLTTPESVTAFAQEAALTEEQVAELMEEAAGSWPLRLVFFKAVNRDQEPRGFRLVKLDRAEYDVLTEYNGLIAPIEPPMGASGVVKTFKLFLERKRKFSLKRIDAMITYFAGVPGSVEAASSSEPVLTPAACEDFYLNEDLMFEHCVLAAEGERFGPEPTAYITARLRHRGRALEAIAEELNLSEEQVAELQESVAHNRITRAIFFTETDEDPSAEGLNFRIFKLNSTQWDALASHEYSSSTADRRFVTFKLAVEPAQWGHILKREPFLLKTTRLGGVDA